MVNHTWYMFKETGLCAGATGPLRTSCATGPMKPFKRLEASGGKEREGERGKGEGGSKRRGARQGGGASAREPRGPKERRKATVGGATGKQPLGKR